MLCGDLKWEGTKKEGMCMCTCVHITDSLHCTAETNQHCKATISGKLIKKLFVLAKYVRVKKSERQWTESPWFPPWPDCVFPEAISDLISSGEHVGRSARESEVADGPSDLD